MKKYFKYLWVTGFISILGCSDFGNTNVSPNGSNVPLTSALLTQALAAFNGAVGGNAVGVDAGLYCQYFSETLYTDNSRYATIDANWTEMSGGMYDLQNIININSAPATKDYAALNGSNANQIAIARIAKAFRFSILTDRNGDIPYSEALKGIPSPKYDAQQDIYTDLFKELTEAVAQFDSGPTVAGDILFAGNTTRWKQFANSLRLILAVRISKADATTGKAQFNSALTADGGVLNTNADDITLTFPGNAAEFNNPWYGIGGDDNVCKTMSDLLNSTSDERRKAYGNVNGSGSLIGVPPGLNRTDALAWVSDPANSAHSLILNNSFRNQLGTIPVLLAADVLLARAEAAVPVAKGGLGWTSEDYLQMYANGIKASWTYWGVYGTGSAYNSYMTNSVVDITTATGAALAQAIGTQR